MINKFVVHVSLSEDINSPYIWISNMDNKSRDIVKIINNQTSDSVWCEAIKASDNYIERYNKNQRTINIEKANKFIILNAWYRNQLSLKKNESCDITMVHKSIPLFIKQLLASYTHPDNSVKIAVDLAFVSVLLGCIGLFLGLISIF